jgi:hypothetical protein
MSDEAGALKAFRYTARNERRRSSSKNIFEINDLRAIFFVSSQEKNLLSICFGFSGERKQNI